MPIGPSRQLRRMQWIAIVLVTAAIALNYMDRSTLAIGNLKIRQEFGLSATSVGALGSAWALTYGIAQLPSGYLLDRIGPRILVGITMVVWSLFQAAGGIASSYTQLMLSRIGLGATEAPCFPRRPARSATGSTSGTAAPERAVHVGRLYRSDAGAADPDHRDAGL